MLLAQDRPPTFLVSPNLSMKTCLHLASACQGRWLTWSRMRSERLKDRYGADLDLEVLVGVYCKDSPKHGDEEKELPSPIGLYSISAPEKRERVGVAEAIQDYSAMGSGGLFAHYLLNRLHDDENPLSELTMEAAVNEAIWVVSEVVKVDLWCGGDIQVACIRKAGDGYTLERKRSADIRKCAIDLADTDTKIKRSHRRMFLGERERFLRVSRVAES